MGAWQLAQMNVATARYPLDDAPMAEFVARLDAINALADASPGFVWRLQGISGNATDIRVDDDPFTIVNMSVWRDVESLFAFAYRSAHQGVMAKRRQWFRRPEHAYQVLWWVPDGHRPSVDEGFARLQTLQRAGPGATAFTFRHRFPPPGRADQDDGLDPAPFCAGWS